MSTNKETSAVNRLRAIYKKTVVPALIKEYGYKNVNEVPRLEKIVLNMGLGDVKLMGALRIILWTFKYNCHYISVILNRSNSKYNIIVD